MKQRKRIYFSAVQKREIWHRWQRGESMSSIERSFERDSFSIHPLKSRTGGIRPLERKRSRLALTLAEREEISRGLQIGVSLRSIVRQLPRSISTISREVRRGGGAVRYRAAASDKAAWNRAHPLKLCKLAGNPVLRRTVALKLKRFWSPQQIAGWLKTQYPGQVSNQISHETIYRSLFVQTRGVLKKELLAYDSFGFAVRR